MQAIPQGALAYFNCGPESGASQPHKHIQVRLSHYSMLHFPAACHKASLGIAGWQMQVVPLPLADDPAIIPSPLAQMMDKVWQDSNLQEGDSGSVHQLPYQNYFSKLSHR